MEPAAATGADESLRPPRVTPAPGVAYAPSQQVFMGIPGIERAPGGRLWACWYSGGDDEGPSNHVVLISSDDEGQSWSAPVLAIDPPGEVRAYDPVLWRDPTGRLWLFWAQSVGWWDGRAGVWAIATDQPDAAQPTWSAPRRLCDGIMMNKPTVLADGRWLLPAAVWHHHAPHRADMAAQRYSNVIISRDRGDTWQRLGGADVPERDFDEHMVVERRDGSLWMLVRTKYGIGQSESRDGGRTWSPGEPTDLGGPNSRFHIRRLRSGRLLLINHYQFNSRSHLTAMLSDDEGRTWPARLLLDERQSVSYPDAVQADDGRLFIIYDWQRYWAKHILLAVVTEQDIDAGRCVTDAARLKRPIAQGSSTWSERARALWTRRFKTAPPG